MKAKNKKLKIVFLCIYSYPSICGVWNRVHSLGKMLVQKGHEVHVFSTNIIKGTFDRSDTFQIYDKINIHRFKSKFSFGENVKFWNFSSKLKEINPDIIIAEVYRHPHTMLTAKLAKKLNKPCFLVTHAPFVEPELRSRLGNIIVKFYDKFYGKKIFKKFDKIITITKWEFPFLNKIGVEKNKLYYLPNGLPEEFFKKQKKNKKIKNILFLGRISEIKDLKTLIIAFNIVIKKFPNIELKFVGPAEENYKKKLTKLIKDLKLKNIKFLPAVYNLNKKIKVLDNSDIFVLPSKREAMPQALIEAMARGKITIASENKGSAEIISDRKNGFLFPISNYEKLAKIIEFCFDKKNKKTLEKIRKNAILKAREFRLKIIFNDFYKLILKYTE